MFNQKMHRQQVKGWERKIQKSKNNKKKKNYTHKKHQQQKKTPLRSNSFVIQ